MKMRKKSDLPVKTCRTCARPFTWRRKWARNWDNVIYCSDRCRGPAKATARCLKIRRGDARFRPQALEASAHAPMQHQRWLQASPSGRKASTTCSGQRRGTTRTRSNLSVCAARCG
ncbi:DUF2256 domain-containing protein [Pannonibacter phragmitetus]|uniref:DUF2256 domain-containing protein n=1 Tax=Pannonibacter phragmitetus TaxID=121719 RepID=UPI003D2EC076